jgi:hypothetical protein
VVAQVNEQDTRVAVSSPSNGSLAGSAHLEGSGDNLTIFSGAFAPGDAGAYDYWNKKFADMVKTKTWKDLLANYQLYDAFMPGDEFRSNEG